MDQKIIKALTGRAYQLAHHIWGPRFNQDWDGFNKNKHKFKKINIKDGGKEIQFVFNDYAAMSFTDIRPTSVTKTKFHEPKVMGSTNVDSHVSKIYNHSDCEISRSYEVEIASETSSTEAVGVSVTAGITQTISYGSEIGPVQGSTEISLEVSSEYNKEWGKAQSESRTTSTEVSVPPKTEVTFTTTRNLSDMEQTVEYWCDLDHKIVLWSHGDWTHEWKSMDELKRVVKGWDEKKPGGWIFTKHGPLGDKQIDWCFGSANVHFKDTVQYKNSTTGDVRVSSKRIK